MSPVSKAQRMATDKYIKEKTDEIKIRVPKGQKEALQAHAEARGESLNGFVTRAINEAIERDKPVL
jgi:predicted HicB family RNase H-like nuclease